MSERGRRGWVRWSTAILVGGLLATGAQAQQTVVGTTSDSQGGFVVIEDTATPPPPPKPVNLPATTAPLAGAAGGAPPYKPGSAVYEIPWAKHGSTSTVPAASPVPASAAAHSAVANASAVAAKAPVSPASTSTVAVAPKPVTPPPPPAPVWNWTIKQGLSLQQQLAEMGKQAHWNVVWDYPHDIIAGADWTSHDDFPTAAAKIIKILALNGAVIYYHTFDGNNTFLVCRDSQVCLIAPAANGTGATTP